MRYVTGPKRLQGASFECERDWKIPWFGELLILNYCIYRELLQLLLLLNLQHFKQMQRFKLVRERGIICHQKIYESGSFSDENSHIKGAMSAGEHAL